MCVQAVTAPQLTAHPGSGSEVLCTNFILRLLKYGNVEMHIVVPGGKGNVTVKLISNINHLLGSNMYNLFSNDFSPYL